MYKRFNDAGINRAVGCVHSDRHAIAETGSCPAIDDGQAEFTGQVEQGMGAIFRYTLLNYKSNNAGEQHYPVHTGLGYHGHGTLTPIPCQSTICVGCGKSSSEYLLCTCVVFALPP